MEIGYPCINWSLCRPNKSFHLKSYSRDKFNETVKHNLECLEEIIKWNVNNGFLFFRISSDTIPFASHEICNVKWWEEFSNELENIGGIIKDNNMRVSMHPGQYTVLNSDDEDVVENSIDNLRWHCRFLDSMDLDKSAKVQVHVGGVYGNKEEAINRFVENYKKLSNKIKDRLVIENDDSLYSLSDCMRIHDRISIPVIFDTFHHECHNNGESVNEGIKKANKTWREGDGRLMIDYSSQKPGSSEGTHAESINEDHFKNFLKNLKNEDLDVMLEIKDKEKSGKKALKIMKEEL